MDGFIVPRLSLGRRGLPSAPEPLHVETAAKLHHQARPIRLMEHMRGAEEYDKSRRYLFEVGKEIGVSFQ